MGKRRDGLTDKQRLFSIAVGSQGLQLTSAYRSAYDCERMAPATIRREATRLAANPIIATLINELRDRRMASEQASQLSKGLSTKQKVLERLEHYSTNADPKDSNRIRALELLGKTCGAFTEVVEVRGNERSSEEIASQIEVRLREIAQRNKALDTDTDQVH